MALLAGIDPLHVLLWGGGCCASAPCSHHLPAPFLLPAPPPHRKLQQRLLLQVLGGASSKGIESVSMERCHALLQDRNGSHLMEVRCMAVCLCAAPQADGHLLHCHISLLSRASLLGDPSSSAWSAGHLIQLPIPPVTRCCCR